MQQKHHLSHLPGPVDPPFEAQSGAAVCPKPPKASLEGLLEGLMDVFGSVPGRNLPHNGPLLDVSDH